MQFSADSYIEKGHPGETSFLLDCDRELLLTSSIRPPFVNHQNLRQLTRSIPRGKRSTLWIFKKSCRTSQQKKTGS